MGILRRDGEITMLTDWQRTAPRQRSLSETWNITKRVLGRAITYLVVFFIALLFMIPFFWTVSSALKHPSELYVFPPKWLPATPQWRNWPEVWRQIPFGKYVLNSFYVTGLAVIGQVVSATLVAYGFARFRFPGREGLFLLVLGTMILPAQVTMIPQFLMFRAVKWLDTYKPLIVPSYFGGGAFFIFLMRQFLMTIPLDMDESARLDGASSLRILINVLLPLCQPALATVAIFSFLGHWNSFLFPMIYLNTMQKFTLPIGLRYFQLTAETGGDPKEHLLMAASLMASIPGIILFFTAQRYFVQGIVMTGIKG